MYFTCNRERWQHKIILIKFLCTCYSLRIWWYLAYQWCVSFIDGAFIVHKIIRIYLKYVIHDNGRWSVLYRCLDKRRFSPSLIVYKYCSRLLLVLQTTTAKQKIYISNVTYLLFIQKFKILSSVKYWNRCL